MRTIANVVYLSCMLGLLPCACVGSGDGETPKEDKQRLKSFILDKPPANVPNKLNINYDGKVTLLGYSIDPPSSVAPGERVKLVMYWRADKKLEEGWNLFTHVVDGSGERILNIDNVGPLREWRETRQVLGPSGWEAGKFYVDEQVFTIPTGVKTSKVQVVTGVWRENTRLKPVSGPHDNEDRGIVVSIPTGVTHTAQAATATSTRVPSLRVDKLEKGVAIRIDGKLDEPAWKTARTAGPFVDVSSGRVNPSSPVAGQVKVLWNDEGILLGFDVKDPDVRGGFGKDEKDPHLWTKDTIEIMVDPDGDGDNRDYYEIQINPQNLVFDSQFDSYNQPKTEPNGPFGHQTWSAKLKSAVSITGTLDKSDDKDEGYVVEAMIPWKSFTKAKKVPPKTGDTWRMNFYAMQDNGGAAWSPILGQGNFHKASRFGQVVWSDPAAAPEGAGSTGEAPGAMADAGALGARPGAAKLPAIRGRFGEVGSPRVAPTATTPR
jgi:hypothetical protein